MEITKYFSTYNTRLGRELFPGQDYYSVSAQTYFSEAWNSYGKDVNNVDEFIHHLKAFTPAAVKDAIDNPTWATETTLMLWEMAKQNIIEVVSSRSKGKNDCG